MVIASTFRSAWLTVAAALAAAAASPAVQPGDQLRWSLDFRVRLEQGAARPVEIHLAGEWVSTVSAVRSGEYDAQLQLANARFAGDAAAGAPAPALEDLRRRLSRPFWATYHEDGGLLAVHFFKDVAPNDRNLLQMIATQIQLVRPETQRSFWTVTERDGAGNYLAMYRRDANEILKRKMKYIY